MNSSRRRSSFSKQYPGGRFGVPYTFRGEGIYYNKALFAKAGITSLPNTYDELVADADKLAAAGIPAMTFGGTVNWHLMRLMDEILEVQCGPEKHDALMAMKASWADEPCATKSFDELHKWTSKYILKPFMGIDNNQSFNLFLAGRAAMMLEGNWLVGQLRNANKLADYGLFPFPGTTRLYGFGEYNYISTKSKNPDIAAKFLDYLESTPVQQANLAVFGGSVNKNVKSDSKEPLDLEWAKIFGQFKDVFVNGDQAFPLGRDDGILAHYQRSRQRSPRSEGGRRRTAEIHRLSQIGPPAGLASPGGRPLFSLCGRNLADVAGSGA